MHDSSYEKMAAFVRVHLDHHRGQPLDIVDFGSQVVDEQGLSYRGLFDDAQWNYRGLDIAAGHNVEIVIADAYDWQELTSDSVDLVISGQAFEHVEYFWASMFEIVRVLKPGGVAAIIAPSGGFEHRYPVDCWRFYRDGFVALAAHVGCDVVDAFTDWGHLDWEDSVLVARKPHWDGADRQRFERRSLLQRALLGDDRSGAVAAAQVDDDATSEAPAASVLADLAIGALTAELDAARRDRIAAQAAAARAADAAPADAAVTVATQAAELDALRARLAAVPAPGPLARSYGSLRARIAGLAGERGRRAYKRLRGRA